MNPINSTHFTYPSAAVQQELRTIADAIVRPGKGTLDVSQCLDSLEKRFSSIGIENTEENRRHYRQMLFNCDKELSQYISSVILNKETLSQTADNRTSFVQLIKNFGMIPGIQIDEGLVDLMGTEGETTTQGLTNLEERLAEYKAAGCNFAMFHCIFKIGQYTPSILAIRENAKTLARFATICQKNGMVPIITPEVMTEGIHSLERTQKVTEVVLSTIFKTLNDYHVFLEGLVLRPNMILPGESCSINYSVQQKAEATILALSRTVPVAVPGIVFISGGQSEEEATVQLNAISTCTVAKKLWNLSFGFDRALQFSALMAWGGKDIGVVAGRKELLKRAKANSEAICGTYTAGSCKGIASSQKLDQYKRTDHKNRTTLITDMNIDQDYHSNFGQQYKNFDQQYNHANNQQMMNTSQQYSKMGKIGSTGNRSHS